MLLLVSCYRAVITALADTSRKSRRLTSLVVLRRLPDVSSIKVEQPSPVLVGQETDALCTENLPDNLPGVSSIEVEQLSSVLDGQGIQLNTESNKVEGAGTLSTTDVSNVLTCSRYYSSSSCQRMPQMRKTLTFNPYLADVSLK